MPTQLLVCASPPPAGHLRTRVRWRHRSAPPLSRDQAYPNATSARRAKSRGPPVPGTQQRQWSARLRPLLPLPTPPSSSPPQIAEYVSALDDVLPNTRRKQLVAYQAVDNALISRSASRLMVSAVT